MKVGVTALIFFSSLWEEQNCMNGSIRVYNIIETIYLKQRLKSGLSPTMRFYCIHTGHFIVNLPKRLKLDNTQTACCQRISLSRYPSDLYVYTHIQICKRCKFHICINRAWWFGACIRISWHCLSASPYHLQTWSLFYIRSIITASSSMGGGGR